ncbi:MAG TPA: cyclophilin-like family protein [Nitrosopumilaceae archaeon]|nr:cyclophilin-like family protein [Nitrosopumilaceae archaeon]
MIHKVTLNIPKIKTIDLEIDDELAPETVSSFLKCLPLDVEIQSWGEELYTNETPIVVGAENAKPLVDLMDVAYWPSGKAICLFFGPTTIGKKDEIKPYSPVNVIGKIKNTDKKFLKNVSDGMMVTFRL